MTDKERIEELEKEVPYYETELYRETCEEVDNADGYDNLVRDIMDYKIFIKELKNNQNQKAVEALEKVKELLNNEEFMVFRTPEMVIEQLIKEYGGKE